MNHDKDEGVMRDSSEVTFGLGEFALFHPRFNGLVELRIKGSRRRDGDFVIGLDILLDSIATAATGVSMMVLQRRDMDPAREALSRGQRDISGDKGQRQHTCCHCALSAKDKEVSD